MRILHLDFETRSVVDLRKCGAWRYSKDASTDILCFAYAWDDDPIQICTHKDILSGLLPEINPKDIHYVVAHNAFFEQCIWANLMATRYKYAPIPIEKWRCSAAKAASLSLPRKLDDVSKLLGLSVTKDMEGHRLMMKMSKPRKPTKNNPSLWHESPADFERLEKYCINDVEVERQVDKRLPPLNKAEQKLWFIDQRINFRGVRLDVDLIDSAIALFTEYEAQLIDKVRNVTGDFLQGTSRVALVREWLSFWEGLDLDDLRKDTITNILKTGNITDAARTILEVRQQLSKASLKKYITMKASMDADDGRLRDLFMMYGAGTGRWSGKIVQLQNLPKGNVKDFKVNVDMIKLRRPENIQFLFGDISGALSSAIRNVLIPSEGYELFVADYAGIEARVVCWLAGDLEAVRKFKEGVDVYVDMAKDIYGKQEISKAERQLGKVGTLGLSYGMGPPKFKLTSESWGIEISEELAKKVVGIYRAKYPKVVDFWKANEQAVIRTLRTGKTIAVGRVTWGYKAPFLVCRLPSGRNMVYYKPYMKNVENRWGGTSTEIHYFGSDSKKQHRFTDQKTWGGSLVENITQAVARDLMAEALVRLEDRGYPIVLHIHDEAGAERKKGEGNLEEFVKIMEELPDWAEGCPISAEGWVGDRYKK